MKHLIAVCFCLCLIAALTPAVSALNNWTGEYVYNGTVVTAPDATGFCPSIGHGANQWTTLSAAYWTSDNTSFSGSGTAAFGGSYTVNGSGTNNNKFQFTMLCTSPMLQYGVGDYWLYQTGEVINPSANFTGTPTSGPASLYVLFTDTSVNSTTSSVYNWSITPTTGVTGYTGSVKDHSASFATPGNYTIIHGVANSIGSDIETKTNYIWVQDYATDYITTGFAAMDNPRWVQLAGATINLLDVENNSWKNASSSATGYEEITTLNNHTISAYASLTGYSDAQLLSKPAWNGGVYQILMYPIGYANVTAGYVTLYVNVWEAPVSARLSGATVNVAYDVGGSQHSDYRITDSSGVVQFVVPNQTTIYIYAEKAGFTRGGTTTASGDGNGGNASVYTDVTLIREYVTTVPTPTTLPGGGTPTATPATVDPYPCDADHPENCQRKQTDMANDLIGVAPDLMWLFVIATIFGVVKMMGK